MKSIIRRYIYFVIALFFNSLGVALITKAFLGTSPISSVPYVLSLFTDFTLGQWTIAFNLILIVANFFILKKDDIKRQWFDIFILLPVVAFFGVFIDFSMDLLWFIEPITYSDQIVALLIGCVILALGVSMEVQADVAMLPGEFIVRAISKASEKEFGLVKLCFDSSLVIASIIISVLMSGTIIGVREGTVIAAIIVGPITRFIRPRMSFVMPWLFPGSKDEEETITDSSQYPIVVTITREFGSGGRILANNLAKVMDVKFFDKEIIEMATQESQLSQRYIIDNEQHVTNSELFSLITQSYETNVEKSMSSSDVLFVTQSKIIRRIAKEQSCVILGRLADYVLADWPKDRIVRVFCYCDPESACERCNNVYHDPWTINEIIKKNEARKTHYEHYTGQRWGDPHNYDLMVNTASITIDLATRLIIALALEKNKSEE
ncbi:MAG: cytidylate kinase family protein [Bacteroidales bacterium]|nr:cytidylate kinase family protein [Bacteroidales bacterium]